VSDSTPRSRPNRANTPACRQAATTLAVMRGRQNGGQAFLGDFGQRAKKIKVR